MKYVCLWSPVWSTDGASAAESAAGSAAEVGPHLAELAPRVRVEPGRIWADGRGLDAVALAARLLDRLATLGVPARAGVSAIPVTAQLAARWGHHAEDDRHTPTPFLVKERTGWGWRKPGGAPTTSPTPPLSARRGERPESTPSPETGGAEEPGHPPSAVPKEVVVVPDAGTSETAGKPGPAGASEIAWLAPLPVAVLEPGDRLRTLLEGVGVLTVGELAALTREAVEVRFGPDAVRLWRFARADDRRVLFRPVPAERPHGEIEFVDYVLTDPARLLFTANALLGPLCDQLTKRGEHARSLRLVLPLADGSEWDRTLRPARPTASRETWRRLIRNILERISVPDAVAGMRMEVGDTEAAAVRQGDLFDRGFATAAALEAAIARLAELQVTPVAPAPDAHPLAERRDHWAEVPLDRVATADPVPAPAPYPERGSPATPRPSPGGVGEGGWEEWEGTRNEVEKGPWGTAAHTPSPPLSPPGEVAERRTPPLPGPENRPRRKTPPTRGGGEEGRGRGALTLQLLPRPRRILVDTVRRRDHETPVRLRDRTGWREVALAAGPDRISGGQWEAEPFAREYFRCVTTEGVMLWVFRDARSGEWWLHGWWD